jgi:hypothetical protein
MSKIFWDRVGYFVLGIAIFIGLITRFSPLFYYSEFKSDQGRDAFVLMQMKEDGYIPLEGPNSSFEGYSLPPFYYYITFPTTFLGEHPALQIIPNALFSFFSIPLLFYFLKYYCKFPYLKYTTLISAFLALVWSFQIKDIVLGNVYWNPGPVTFFTLLYLVLMGSLEFRLKKGLGYVYTSILLGIVIAFACGLHSITMVIFPSVTAMCFYYLFLSSRFDRKRLYAYLIVLFSALLCLIPYFFAENNIFASIYHRYMGGDELIKVMVKSIIVLGIIFILVNLCCWRFIIEIISREFTKNLVVIALLMLSIGFIIFNFDDYIFSIRVLLGNVYLPFGNEMIDMFIKYLFAPTVLLGFTAFLFRLDFVNNIYLLIFLILAFLSQFFVYRFQIYYLTIIYLIPVVIFYGLIDKINSQVYRKICLLVLIIFGFISMIVNGYYSYNYVYILKYKHNGLITVNDINQAFQKIPERSCIKFDDEKVYNQAYQYIAMYMTKKDFSFSAECPDNGYVLSPKYGVSGIYLPGMISQNDYKEFDVFFVGNSYYIYRI